MTQGPVTRAVVIGTGHYLPARVMPNSEFTATLDTSALGARRTLNMPGVAATVAEEIAALRRVRGADAEALIDRKPDAAIEEIIAGWPRSFSPERARRLGFAAETTVDELIEAYLADDAPELRP